MPGPRRPSTSETNASIHEPIAGDPEESVPNTPSHSRQYVREIEHALVQVGRTAGRVMIGTTVEWTGRRIQRRSPCQCISIEHTGRMDKPWLMQWMIQVSVSNITWLCLINPCTGYLTTRRPQGDEIAWWIAQMILSVHTPALLTHKILAPLNGELPQILIDESSSGTDE